MAAEKYVLTGSPGRVARLLAYLTSGCPGGTRRQVLAPVVGNHTLPCPATRRKSSPGLSGSGLGTQRRTPSAELATEAPSTPHTPSARSAGPVTRPRDSVEGTPATRTPGVPGKQAAVDSGRRLRSSGGVSRSNRKRRKGKIVSTEGLICRAFRRS